MRHASLGTLALVQLTVAAAAQAQAIGGRVLDDAKGTPLAHVRASVRLPDGDSTVTVETAPDGTFILALPRPGRYRVHFAVDSLDAASDSIDVEADGFVQKEFRVALGARVSRPVAEDAVGDLTGVVVDRAGKPLARVDVTVEATGLATRTDSTGAFHIARLAVGPQLLRVRRIGLAPRTIPITVTPGAMPVVEIALDQSVQQLDAVSVRTPRTYAMLGGQTFEQRRKMGSGTFFGPEDIARAHPLDVVEILRRARGIRFEYDGRTGLPRIYSSRGGSSIQSFYCVPRLFLDAVPVGGDPSQMLATLPITHVLAIEVYPGPATTPQEFGGAYATCGAVAIWTRTGALPDASEESKPARP